MPTIRVELYPGRSPSQKEACAREILQSIEKHFGVPPSASQVVYSEIERFNWLKGTELLPATTEAK